MKQITTVILLALFTSTYAQDEGLMQDAITKPALSLRCREMLKEREAKVKVQQRLNALLQRNQDLIKKSPNANASIQNRLKANQVRLKNELHLTASTIQSIEESIIRSGCPGISL